MASSAMSIDPVTHFFGRLERLLNHLTSKSHELELKERSLSTRRIPAHERGTAADAAEVSKCLNCIFIYYNV